jgi:hypothetical protein
MTTKKFLLPVVNIEVRDAHNLLLGILVREVFNDEKGKYYYLAGHDEKRYFTSEDKNVKEIYGEIIEDLITSRLIN